MKNSKATIVFIVSSALLVFSHVITNAQSIPLDQAVKDGKVKIEITGLGGSTGDTILLNVQRQVQETLRLNLTPGTVFKSTSGNVQNMIGARIKGERVGQVAYLPISEISLPNDKKREYIVEAYCLDFHKSNPGSSDAFILSSPDKRIRNIIVRGQEDGHSMQVIQSAIWIDHDKVTPSRLKTRFPVSDKDIETAQKLLKEVERSRMSKLFVKTSPDSARVRILNIKPKFYQGIVLEPGKYHIEVSAIGYKTHRKWIEIDEGEDKRILIFLTSDGT